MSLLLQALKKAEKTANQTLSEPSHIAEVNHNHAANLSLTPQEEQSDKPTLDYPILFDEIDEKSETKDSADDALYEALPTDEDLPQDIPNCADIAREESELPEAIAFTPANKTLDINPQDKVTLKNDEINPTLVLDNKGVDTQENPVTDEQLTFFYQSQGKFSQSKSKIAKIWYVVGVLVVIALGGGIYIANQIVAMPSNSVATHSSTPISNVASTQTSAPTNEVSTINTSSKNLQDQKNVVSATSNEPLNQQALPKSEVNSEIGTNHSNKISTKEEVSSVGQTSENKSEPFIANQKNYQQPKPNDHKVVSNALDNKNVVDSQANQHTLPQKDVAEKSSSEKNTQERISLTRSTQKYNRIDGLLTQAWQALDAGDLMTAKNIYEKILTLDTRQVDAWLGIAAILVNQQKHDQAKKIYQDVLVLEPKNPTALLGISQLNGQHASQETQLKQLLSQSPSAEIYFSLGNLYANKQSWHEAQQAYFNAVKLDGLRPDYLYNLAVSLDNIHQLKLALNYYEQVLQVSNQKKIGFSLSQVKQRIEQLKQLLNKGNQDNFNEDKLGKDNSNIEDAVNSQNAGGGNE